MGPLPPPYGGIATIVGLLSGAAFKDQSTLVIQTTLRNRSGSTRLLHAVRTLWKLLGALMRQRPDALLCFSSAYSSFWEKAVWAEAARIFAVKTAVVMVDGQFPSFEQGLGKVRRRVVKFVLGRFKVVGVQSEGWLNYYRGLCQQGRYSVISGGVPHDIFAPLSRARQKNDPVRILYVGWMIKEKGIYDLLQAAEEIKNCGLRFEMRFVGPLFTEEPKLRMAIALANLDDCVNIVGPVAETSGLIGEYRGADLFVLPCGTEGFPNSILEAMAVGLPVVATTGGAVPEIVDNEITGLLVPPGDPERLSAAMAVLIKDSALRQRMGTAGRAKVLAEYTLDHALATYQELFTRLRSDSSHMEQSTDRIMSKEKCAE